MAAAGTTLVDGAQPQRPHTSTQPTVQQRFDFAFSLYSTRAREELHEFRALCAAIAHGAQEEKRQWQALCARVMQERDACKVKLQETIATQQLGQSGSSTHSSSPSMDAADTVKRESPEPASLRGVKRTAEPHAIPPHSHSRSGSPRSVGTRSPPPVTPMLLSPTPTIPPATHSPSGSDNEGSSSRGSPSPSCASYSDFGHGHAAKRRKSSFDVSCDLPTSLDAENAKRTPAPPLPSDFTHVDLMYNRQMNGSLVCRACL